MRTAKLEGQGYAKPVAKNMSRNMGTAGVVLNDSKMRGKDIWFPNCCWRREVDKKAINKRLVGYKTRGNNGSTRCVGEIIHELMIKLLRRRDCGTPNEFKG